jgi:hypothetical protein
MMSFEMEWVQMCAPVNIWCTKFITVIQSTEPICQVHLQYFHLTCHEPMTQWCDTSQNRWINYFATEISNLRQYIPKQKKFMESSLTTQDLIPHTLNSLSPALILSQINAVHMPFNNKLFQYTTYCHFYWINYSTVQHSTIQQRHNSLFTQLKNVHTNHEKCMYEKFHKTIY